jgi:hypothetical protein
MAEALKRAVSFNTGRFGDKEFRIEIRFDVVIDPLSRLVGGFPRVFPAPTSPTIFQFHLSRVVAPSTHIAARAGTHAFSCFPLAGFRTAHTRYNALTEPAIPGLDSLYQTSTSIHIIPIHHHFLHAKGKCRKAGVEHFWVFQFWGEASIFFNCGYEFNRL